MPLELGIWRIDSGVQQLEQRGLDLECRLEQILHGDVSMLSPNWMVIGRQVKTAYDKKIDLLCMDRDGNLIVIELKRNMTERDTVAQALDYGSWVRTVRADEIARIFDNIDGPTTLMRSRFQSTRRSVLTSGSSACRALA